MPETLGFLLTHLSSIEEESEREHLMAMENQVADRMFLLIEEVFRLGVTRKCRGYEPTVVRSRMEPILELAELIPANR